MRWFIVLLLVANLALFFWLQHDALRDEPVVALPPPDIGRLQLLDLNRPDEKPASDIPTVVDSSPRSAFDADPPGRLPGVDSARPVVASVTEPEDPAGEGPLSRGPPDRDMSDGLPEIDSNRTIDAPATDAPVPPDSELSELSIVASASPTPADGPETAVPVPVVASPDAGPASEGRQAEEVDAPVESGDADTVAESPSEPPAPPAEGPAAPPAAPTCARVGPLSAAAADALIARLPVFITLLSEATEEVDEVDSYYVMIPPLPSRAAGLETLAALEAAGITDTWLFRRGSRRNAISLGLFSRRPTAERHLRDVTAKGFDARLIERTKRREVRQLLVKNVDGGDVALSLPLLEGVTADPQPCP